jgi:hypothetical protein
MSMWPVNMRGFNSLIDPGQVCTSEYLPITVKFNFVCLRDVNV